MTLAGTSDKHVSEWNLHVLWSEKDLALGFILLLLFLVFLTWTSVPWHSCHLLCHQLLGKQGLTATAIIPVLRDAEIIDEGHIIGSEYITTCGSQDVKY